MFVAFLSMTQRLNCSSNSGSSDSGSSSDSSSGSSSGSDSSEDCDCSDLENRLSFLESQFSKFEDQEEIRQLVWGLSYEFDNWANGDNSVDVYANWLRNNTVEDLVTIAGPVFTFNSRAEFIATIIQLDAIGFNFNHFILPGGVRFLECTDDYARVRQNQYIGGIQLDFDDFTYKQDNTWEAPFFEFVKIDGKWLFTSITSAKPFTPCLIESPYDLTLEECLVTLETLQA